MARGPGREAEISRGVIARSAPIGSFVTILDILVDVWKLSCRSRAAVHPVLGLGDPPYWGLQKPRSAISSKQTSIPQDLTMRRSRRQLWSTRRWAADLIGGERAQSKRSQASSAHELPPLHFPVICSGTFASTHIPQTLLLLPASAPHCTSKRDPGIVSGIVPRRLLRLPLQHTTNYNPNDQHAKTQENRASKKSRVPRQPPAQCEASGLRGGVRSRPARHVGASLDGETLPFLDTGVPLISCAVTGRRLQSHRET